MRVQPDLPLVAAPDPLKVRANLFFSFLVVLQDGTASAPISFRFCTVSRTVLYIKYSRVLS